MPNFAWRTLSERARKIMINVSKIFYSLSLLFLLSVFVETHHAQDTRRKSPVNNNTSVSMKELTPNQQQALLLLDTLYEKAKDFENKSLKIRVQSQIADTLWLYNETYARQLFTQVFLAIESLEKSSEAKKNQSDTTHSDHSVDSLRQEVIQIILRRDADFGKQLLESIKDKKSKDENNISVTSGQNAGIEKEIQLAIATVKTNPEGAAQIVRRILSYEFSEMVIPVIMEIRRKNVTLANELYTYAMVVARKGSPSIIKIVSLGVYLLPSDEDEFYGQSEKTDLAQDLLMNQYVDFAYNALVQWVNIELNNPHFEKEKAEQDFAILQQLILPLISKNSPDKANELRARLTALASARNIKKFSQVPLPDENDIASVLSTAQSSNSEKQKDALYVKAAMLAAQKNDFEQALSIVEKINNEKDKLLISSIVRYQAGLKALHQGKVDIAYNHAAEIGFIPQRARLFDEIARHLLKKKDVIRATEILNEIRTWLNKADNPSQKADGLLIVATTIAGYDTIQGFEAAREAIKAINSANFSPNQEKDVEKASNLKVIPITLENLNFKPVFSLLTKTDFNQALSLANSLEKREVFVMAQLAICQEVLKSEPRQPKNKSKKSSSKK